MKSEIEQVIINEDYLKDKIYTIRGQKVMLDFDLAKIYGYSTKAFNQQVQRNIEKFDDDFMFQLTKREVEYISRCKNFTTIMQNKGTKGGRVYLPFAFTESGIYMLMTVLKGDLAIKQSKALIRTFKAMKDYIIENNSLLPFNEIRSLKIDVKEVKTEIKDTKQYISIIKKLLNNNLLVLK